MIKDLLKKQKEEKTDISPSDKTLETTAENWHKQALELSEVDELTETINNGKYVEAHIVKDLLTSATIKAKEDVLRDIIAEHVNRQSHVDILVKGTVARYILKYAKEKGINLEEPSK